MVDQRFLGHTGIKVSELAFGTVSLGIDYGINARKPHEKEAISLLNAALERGINFYDTARGYGTSEQVIGKAFVDKRHDVVICSKPDHLYDSVKDQPLPSDKQLRSSLENSFEKSLKNLKTDYIDIYMSHDCTQEVIQNETIIGFFNELKQKGAIKASGISIYTPQQAELAISNGNWDVIQAPFNLMDQRLTPAMDLAAKKGVGIVVRSVLFKGILTPKGDQLHPSLEKIQNWRKKYLPLCEKTGWTLSQLAAKFVLSLDSVSSVLIGIDKLEYLEMALASADKNYLTGNQLQQAKSLAFPEPDFIDLSMWARKGWL
jgi:aryl-alcohol dehydrogenase-like predicted oxidoreductase